MVTLSTAIDHVCSDSPGAEWSQRKQSSRDTAWLLVEEVKRSTSRTATGTSTTRSLIKTDATQHLEGRGIWLQHSESQLQQNCPGSFVLFETDRLGL